MDIQQEAEKKMSTTTLDNMRTYLPAEEGVGLM